MRSAYENAMKEMKAVLNARRSDAEATFSREQKITMENEIRRLKRVRMNEMHALIEKLVADVCFLHFDMDSKCLRMSFCLDFLRIRVMDTEIVLYFNFYILLFRH